MRRISDRALTRTLWVRQQLVPSRRTIGGVTGMVEHLIGLQAQENLPPYLSLAARLDAFDPSDLSVLLESRALSRFLTMRGTVHVLTPGDALSLRSWVQPALDRLSASSAQNKPAAHLTNADLEAATRALLGGGALPVSELGSGLAATFPGVPETVLRHVVRERVPLLQTPPRGLWKRSGGVVYAFADDWLGRPFGTVDLPDLVRRYLRAYGPAAAADMTKWSTVTRLAPTFTAMHRAGELVRLVDDRGRTLYDVPDGVIAEDDLELAPLLLGTYDNVFLSHADRDRIAPDPARKRWMGTNGAMAATVFLDGLLAGLWRLDGDRIELELFGRATAAQRRGLEREKERVRSLLARPAPA